MTGIDRRKLLGLGLGAAGAASLSGTRTAEAQAEPPPPPPHWDYSSLYPARRTRPGLNPISFWNDTALQLTAIDHSIDARDARAPGPCAAARALGLVHIVMADAAAAVYPVDFEGFYVRGVRFPPLVHPEVFVGGAAAWILEHIFSTPAHTQFLGAQRLRFLKHYDPQASAAWDAGLTFARNEAYTSRWDWRTVKSAALTSSQRYRPHRGQHDVDPYNPDQKFYGVTWGYMEPLVRGLPLAALDPGEPPGLRDPQYARDAEEVRELGAFHSDGPSADQVRVGLFWAYCGARLVGPPARLYNQIVRQIVETDDMPVPEMARALALCNIALADAGISAWRSKYRYKVWRPVVGIPAYFDRGSDWKPFGSPRTNPAQFALGSDTQFRLMAQSLEGGGYRNALRPPTKDLLSYHRACFTPNFPSYPSGHAVFGSACFTMLKLVRGEHERFQGDPGRLDGHEPFVSDEVNGISIDNFNNERRPYVPISYRHIDQMIHDNAKSRVHLGVHWNFDCDRGNESGARLAELIYRNIYRRKPAYRPDDPDPQRRRRGGQRSFPAEEEYTPKQRYTPKKKYRRPPRR